MELQKALKTIVDTFATETDTQTLITVVPFDESREHAGRRYFGIKIDDAAETPDVKLGAVLHSGLMAEDEYSGLETDLLYELQNTARHKIPGGRIIWFCGLEAIPAE